MERDYPRAGTVEQLSDAASRRPGANRITASMNRPITGPLKRSRSLAPEHERLNWLLKFRNLEFLR